MAEIRKFHLKVGQEAHVKKGFLFLGSYRSLIYAGMPNDKVCSLVVTWSQVYNSMSYNLYNPVDQKSFQAAGGKIELIEATPEYILFNFIN